MNSTAISIVKAVINDTHDVATLKEISGVRDWQFNEQAKKLLQDGFIKRKGNAIELQENVKAILLKKISQRWNLESLLRDSNELVFSHLAEPLTVSEILAKTGLSTATVYRAVSDLGAIGAIQKKTSEKGSHGARAPERIRIDPSKTDLIDFAKILKTERERTYEPDAEIIYTDREKTLKKVTRGRITEGELTSFSVFADNGVQYESPYDYYVRQKDPVDIHDIIIHSVLASYKDGDKMGLIMATVFYVKNKNKADTRRLREIAASFGISSIWLDVEAYVRRQKVKDEGMFLPWSEFVSKIELYGIDSERYVAPTPTSSLFEDIGDGLDSPMRIFLIGGENMRLKNLKAVTKDCDIIVENPSDFEVLCRILTERLGYKKMVETEYSQEDLRIYPDEILIHPDRSRIDLFTKRVMRGLSLSDAMIGTADYATYGKLKVGALRNEHVFLLKAVASREGDIQDMAKLSQGSLNQPREFEHGRFDWDQVWQEIIHQEKMNPIQELTVSIFEQISLLAEQTGIVAPILEKLKRHAIERLILRMVRGGRQPLKEIVFRLYGGDISEQMVRNRVDALVKDGVIRKYTVEKKVFAASVRMPHFPHADWQTTSENVAAYLNWRFPMREQSTYPTIQKFADEAVALGYSSVGCLDETVVKQIDRFLDYECRYPPKKDHKSADIARACIGLSDPKLGKDAASNFHVSNFEEFVRPGNETKRRQGNK